MKRLIYAVWNRFLDIHIPLPSFFSSPVTRDDSPHIGHSRWQLFTPAYHLGRIFNYVGNKASVAGDPQTWYSVSGHFPKRSMQHLAARSNRRSQVTDTYDGVFDEVIKRPHNGPVISVGCGEAQILSHLVNTGRIDVLQTYGCDLLLEKVVAARRSIFMAHADAALILCSKHDDVEVLSALQRNIFPCDLLSEQTPWPESLVEAPALTVVFSSVLTVFSRDELERIVSVTMQLKPTYIVANHPPAISHYNRTAIRSIEPLFEKFGFKEIFFDWAVKPMRVRDAVGAFSPRTWWGENSVSVVAKT